MALMYTPRKHYTSRHCVFQMVRAQRQLFELLVVHPEECSDASYVLVTAMVFAKGAQLEHGGLDDCKQCESALLVLECTCRTAHTHHAIRADLGLDRRYRNTRIPRMCVLQLWQPLIFFLVPNTRGAFLVVSPTMPWTDPSSNCGGSSPRSWASCHQYPSWARARARRANTCTAWVVGHKGHSGLCA